MPQTKTRVELSGCYEGRVVEERIHNDRAVMLSLKNIHDTGSDTVEIVMSPELFTQVAQAMSSYRPPRCPRCHSEHLDEMVGISPHKNYVRYGCVDCMNVFNLPKFEITSEKRRNQCR